MSIRHAAAVLAALAVPAVAEAQDAPFHADPGKGWYFSGKGGPSFESLSGVTAAQPGATVPHDGGTNVVGAFGMAGGYEWMYRYHIPLRTELEFINRTEMTYDASPLLQGRSSGALASTVQNVTTMAKAYWHFPVHSDKWWPFVSGGLGWSRNTAKSEYTPTGAGQATKYNNAVDDLAWSVGAGATFKLGPDVMNDIELRYVDLGKADWGLPGAANVKSDPGRLSATEVVFSLRYMF